MTIETIDSEDGFDAIFDHVWTNWREKYEERLSWIAEEWDRAVSESSTPGHGEVAIALDGDEPGQKAMNELMVKFVSDSDSRTNYLRCMLINKGSPEQCIRSLTNWELADDTSWWGHMRKISGAPEWWYDMAQEQKEVCLGEITRRSRKLNESSGIEYIKTFNETNTITSILSQYGVNAVPGKTVRCPMHDDSSPSLSISSNDKRGYCFSQSCILWHDGYGVDPFELNKILSR